MARWLPRVRRDLNPRQPATTARQHAIFVRRTGYLLEGAAVAVATVGMLASLATWGLLPVHGQGLMGLLLVPTAVLILGTFAVVLTTGQLGSRVKGPGEPPTQRVHRDDDRYWRGGQIYVNRDDPAWLVPRRFGYGYTVNMGHPGSWVALTGLLVVLVGLPFLLSH